MAINVVITKCREGEIMGFKRFCRNALYTAGATIFWTFHPSFSAGATWRGLKWFNNKFDVSEKDAVVFEILHDNWHLDMKMPPAGVGRGNKKKRS
jgi:hypothetical protein